MKNPALRAALLETRAVYRRADAAFSRYACPGCGECCQLRATGRQPWLWRPEWLVVLEGVRRSHGGVLPKPRADGGCPFLDAGGTRCTIHLDRPFGCRTYFCDRCTGPAHPPTDEVVALSRRLEAASLRVDEALTGPRPILEWVEDERGGTAEEP